MRGRSRGGAGPTGAAGATLTTWGGIPETGTAPLGGRFLLVTDAQENGCNRRIVSEVVSEVM